MHRMSFRFLSIAGTVVCLFSGCSSSGGPPLANVTGTITMNDEPLPGVKVVFVPEDNGSPSYGATDDNGVFQLQFNQNRTGAQLGTHNVLIEAIPPETDDSGNILDSTPIVKIPKKYQQPGVLTAEVSSGSNEFDFDLDARD